MEEAAAKLIGAGLAVIGVIGAGIDRRICRMKGTQSRLDHAVGDEPDDGHKDHRHGRDKKPVAGNVGAKAPKYGLDGGFGDAKQECI